MASRCNTKYFLLPRLLLALVWTMTCHFSVTESAAKIQLRGEVGGNVTFPCNVATERKIKFLYFQKNVGLHRFVNGYHATNNIQQTWENTRMDHNYMHMYNLNVSHSGDYQCVVLYSDGNNSIDETDIHLSVTANYSKPDVTVDCKGDNVCWVTCASHGGYPSSKMNVAGSPMLNVVNSSEMHDPDTLTFNSSSTASLNCSNGEPTLLSCSVGDVTPESFLVCQTKGPPYDNRPKLIAAATCAVLVFVITGVLLLCWKYKKGQRSSSSRCEARVLSTAKEYEEEVMVLNEKKGGEDS